MRVVQILFISQEKKHILDCFDVQAFQYMLKPIHLLNKEHIILRISHIVSLEKIKHSLCQNKVEISLIHKNAPLIVTGTLAGFAEKLDPKLFLLIHRSVIVNINYVHNFTCNSVIMSNQTRFPIGRSHSKKFKDLYC